jgi:hypothetical protein
MMNNPIVQRLKIKSRKNQLAIAVGSSLSPDICSIPKLTEDIISLCDLKLDNSPLHQDFRDWNKLIEKAEEKVSRDYLVEFAREKISSVNPCQSHYKIASLPISNFIDATFDRSLYKAIIETGKHPVIHDWNCQRVGAWEQTNPDQPNVFFSFCDLFSPHPWYGIYEPTSKDSQNLIQLRNISEMLEGRDLLLAGFTYGEAEFIIHLSSLLNPCNKIVNCMTEIDEAPYWCQTGTYIIKAQIEDVIDNLLPSRNNGYTFWDMQIPRRTIMDVTRDKEYDCFISHFSGDKSFARRLTQDLELRGLYIWIDENEIDIGDSLSDKIQHGLINSYSFAIILSEESILRPWVKEELRAAYALRLAVDYKILPILYKDCEIPLFLKDYAYADFRSESRYQDQLSDLERSIKNSMLRARNKK